MANEFTSTITNSIGASARLAYAAGALYEARENYRDQGEYGRLYERGNTTFAVRWFNANLDEVGYYLPDVGTYGQFATPRVWGEEELLELKVWYRVNREEVA